MQLQRKIDGYKKNLTVNRRKSCLLTLTAYYIKATIKCRVVRGVSQFKRAKKIQFKAAGSNERALALGLTATCWPLKNSGWHVSKLISRFHTFAKKWRFD